MKYLIITCIIFITAVILSLVRGLGYLSIEYNSLLDTAIIIMSTFIGVFIALYFSNLESKRLEKKKTITLLESAYGEINDIRLQFYNYSKLANDLNVEISKIIVDDPLRSIDFFKTLIENDLVIRNIDALSLSIIRHKCIELDKLIYLINKNLQVDNLNLYDLFLKYTSTIISLEIEYLNQKLKLNKLRSLQKELDQSLIKNDFSDLDNLYLKYKREIPSLLNFDRAKQ
ncbi:MAG: hypothetical protein OEZ22_15120 [Spirochaetia bacterium]|nr:hypothetical protein [Spirochaetia bacterium]